MPRRAPYERYKREDVKIAGVTFANDRADGGENRQTLLAKLYGEPSLVRLENCTFFRPETGKVEPAIKVRSIKLNRIIGYIPKSQVSAYQHQQTMVLQVTKHKDTYGGTLTVPENPSAKQYGTLLSLQRKGQAKMPYLYDKTSYQWALAQCMEAHC